MTDRNSTDLFKNETEISYLKASFDRLDKRLGVHQVTPQRLSRSFQRKLNTLAFPPKKSGVSWKAFWAAILASFSLGTFLNFVVLRPATMTASNQTQPVEKIPSQPDQTTHLAVNDPEGYVKSIVITASKAHLETTVSSTEEGLKVVVKDLKPNAIDQVALKKLLKLDDQFGGADSLILTKLTKKKKFSPGKPAKA